MSNRENILQQIVLHKKQEVAHQKAMLKIDDFKSKIGFHRKNHSLQKSIEGQKKPFLIAEFKRRSPSKGIINNTGSVKDITLEYQIAGASAISILTDNAFFGGSTQDIIAVREQINLPILRKDFIVDEFQLYESKAIGADIVLLIAGIFSKQQLAEYTHIAQSIGLEVLAEIHGKDEIKKLPHRVNFIGVNNRNLATFNVDIQHAQHIVQSLPNESIKIAESGVRHAKDAQQLIKYGFNGLLVGEYLMKSQDINSSIQSLTTG